MQKTLRKEAEQYAKQNRQKRIWHKIVQVMACVVVFCTTYALILPAITMEQIPCDLEEHIHSESCYKKVEPESVAVLVCSYESLGVHVHTSGCYDNESQLVCGQADYLIHTHTDECLDGNGNLVCHIPEMGAHVHTDDCYKTVEPVPEETEPPHSHGDECYTAQRGELICQLAETEGHSHEQCCFTQGKLICQLTEQPGHTHGEGCSETVLVCELTVEPHVHGDGCYQKRICDIPEGEGHTHTEECSGVTLCCSLTEQPHVHTNACYQTNMLCDLPETEGHTHGAECYEALLICGLAEEAAHQHSDECYEMLSVLICELEESVIPDTSAETQEGTEPERELICTEPAAQVHVHSEACFAEVALQEDPLTCTLPEDENHTHGAQCYGTWELICGKEEHTHNLVCMNDPEADLETEADWKATFADVVLTGEWDQDLLAIARSQLGYEESTRNYVVLEDGETIRGYTRYGAWYRSPYGDWCAMFVSFCLNYAEVPQDAIPYEAKCTKWISALQEPEYDLYWTAEAYTPVPGDLIFFDWEEDGEADHVGIVTEIVPATEEEPAMVRTIEGNNGKRVSEREYPLDDSVIVGYGKLPKKLPVYCCGLQEHSHDVPCTDEHGELICGLKEHVHSLDCGTLTAAEQQQVQQVISLIDVLPSADEIDATIEEFENAEDYEGEEAWLSEIYPLVSEIYHIYYEPLTDNQKVCVVNADKLLELEYIWSATVLVSYKFPVNFEVPVVAVNSTEGSSRDEWQGYVLTKSWLAEHNPSLDAFDKPGSPIGMAYPYFRCHVIKANPDGSLTVDSAIQAGALSNYTAQDLVDALGESDGFFLISNTAVEGGIGTDYYDGTDTVAQVSGFDWKTASGAQTYAAVNMNFASTEGEVHVADGTSLRQNIQTVGTRTVVMDADLNVGRDPLILSPGCHITLDLNGHLLTQNVDSSHTGPLFEIPSGASLTIMDSQMGTETVEIVSGNAYANAAALAVADSGDATLTYYVTETNVVDSSIGATQETLKKHTVSTRGAIVVSDQTAFHVTGGDLFIKSGMIRGGTNRAILQTSGLTHISGGYICGFHYPYTVNVTETSYGFTDAQFGGAVRIENGRLEVSGTAVLAGNSAVSGGAVSISGTANMNLSGGVISGNQFSFETTSNPKNWDATENLRGGGGVILLDSATMNMTGGYITNNYSESAEYYDGGAGVYLRGSVTMNLSGGYITGNKTYGGGGIKTAVKSAAKLYMSGGFVSGNIATNGEGAGISIENTGFGEITRGYITNNRILTTVHWGGGGLFNASNSKLYLQNSLITNNDAGGYGGGIAGCSTGDIYLFVDAGCAAFDNSACVNQDSPHFVDAGSGKYGIDLQICDEVFQNHGNKDYFCAENSTVTGVMLGGGSNGWEGTADGAVVIVERDDTITANEVMGLEAHPTEEAKQAAYGAAKVYINGNYSYTHGGGVLCNGELIIGIPEDVYVPARLQLQVTKSLQNSAGEQQSLEGNDFSFRITEAAPDGNVAATGTCGTDGYITFDKQLVFHAPGTYTYYVSEIPGEKTDEIIYDHGIYRLTLVVDLDDGVLWYDGSTKYSYQVTSYTVEKSEDQGETWRVVSAGTGPLTGAINLPLTTGYSFINYTMAFTDITVKKVWQGASEESVTVFLKQDGVRYGDPVTLSSANSWTYTWEKLPGDHEYTVEEETPEGYTANYQYATSSGEPGSVTLSGNVWWVPATSLTVGQEYMILSPDMTTALSITDAHTDLGFDTGDTEAVTSIVGNLTINGNSYSSAIADSEATSRAKFTAQSFDMSKTDKDAATTTATILKCNGADSWLSLEEAKNNGNWLKGTTGAQWASSLTYDGTWLRGHIHNYTESQLRTFIFRNGVFTTNVVSQPVNGALLFTRVTGTATQATATEDAIVTITNTLKTNDLTIGKTVEGNYQDQQKAFLFELQLTNIMFALNLQYDAVRIAADGTVTTETITLSDGRAEITLKHGESVTIPDLPYGTIWTVTEKNADGYIVAYTVNDSGITLGKTVSGTTGGTDIAVSFNNKPGYKLPKTGGTGTLSYTMAGLVLMLCSMAYLMYSTKARRRENHQSA